MIPYRLSAALAVACALAVSGCASETTAPRRPPPRRPQPRPRSRPRPPRRRSRSAAPSSRRRPRPRPGFGEAEVQLSGGVASGSIADGTFTIPNVANGSYTLRVAKAGYETQTQSVTVSGANVGGLVFNLLPVFRWVDREFTAELKQGDAPCTGTNKPCRSYSFGAHHAGDVRAFAAWNGTLGRFRFRVPGATVTWWRRAA